jgi:UDP-N-acetylglucosamine/UDP-N-acetyl-alpha-D-glucosaminouronate 4-epimerase
MALHLVTGIAGFIGSSIARELLSRGEAVRGLDNFSTGKPENLADLRELVDFREIDLLDLPGVAEACHGVDYLLHQAAIPSVPRSVANPIETNRSNIDGTLNLLVAARDAKVKRVVYASSSSLYGDTPTLPKREDMQPNPISPYAVSKLTGEYYMTSFYRVYGLETVSLRYFNVFGPYQDPTSMYSGVMAIFISKMLAGEQPTIHGDGEQSRDFTFIANVVNANLLACHAPANEVAGRAFNVATQQRVTLNETYSLLQDLTGYAGAAKYGPERAGDIKHSLADVTLAKNHLGYSPAVGFEEGLKRTVTWYRERSAKTVSA